MASENLVNNLFEIIQSNTKEKLSYGDFEKDLIKSINLPNDEMDRALSIMLSQAEVNPNIIGESKGGTFVISPSFSTAVISTIKYENQFIEGKSEKISPNVEKATNLILTAMVVDSMLTNIENLTENDFDNLFDNYSNLTNEQQRKIDIEHARRMQDVADRYKNSSDEDVKLVSDGLAKESARRAKAADKFRNGDYDPSEVLKSMKETPYFAEYLLHEKGIVLTDETTVTTKLFGIFQGFLGKQDIKVEKFISSYEKCKELLMAGNFDALKKYKLEDPMMAKIIEEWIHAYQTIESSGNENIALTDEQMIVHNKMKEFVKGVQDYSLQDLPYVPNNEYNSKDFYSFIGSVPKEIQEHTLKLKALKNKTIVSDRMTTKTEVSEIIQGVTTSFIEYGADPKTVLEGLDSYAKTLDNISSIVKKTDKEELVIGEEEPEEWGVEPEEFDYAELFKGKLKEESSKVKKENPIRANVIDVMAGITYGGTIQEKMKNAKNIELFCVDVTRSIEEVDKKIKTKIPIQESRSPEIDRLMEEFMKKHSVEMVVDVIPEERFQDEEEPTINDQEIQPSTESYEEKASLELKTEKGSKENTEEKESEDRKDVGKSVKKIDFFSPSDFDQAMDIFSTMRTSQYVSVFEEVTNPLKQQEQKKDDKGNEEQSRTDDEEPGQ